MLIKILESYELAHVSTSSSNSSLLQLSASVSLVYLAPPIVVPSIPSTHTSIVYMSLGKVCHRTAKILILDAVIKESSA